VVVLCFKTVTGQRKRPEIVRIKERKREKYDGKTGTSHQITKALRGAGVFP
jgi:hypothetical protein